jgi:hypothetical protein
VVSNRDGRWVGCADCHDEAQWAPSSFGLERHATASAFPLTGAHVATPCFLCHVESDDASGSFVLGFEETTCISCHVDDDPHEGQYGDTACETCHVTEAFTSIQYTHTEIDLAGRSCRSCHDDRNPHMGQFADQDCSACHTTDEYLIPEFDHASTRFPLDGAHAPLECAACHMEESDGSASFIRYTPLGTECSDCHGGLQ